MNRTTMKMRTRQEEKRYNQALGYGWAMKDATPYSASTSRRTLAADVLSFATWYSVVESYTGRHFTLTDGWNYFTDLSLKEQAAYGSEWMRLAFTP